MSAATDQGSLPRLRRPWTLAPNQDIRRAAAWFAILAAAAIWTLLVRAPWRTVEGSDDAFYMEVAHLWTRGVLPYVGAFDVKPPGFFAILAAAEALLGSSLQTLKDVSIAFDAATATALYLIGCRMGSRGIGVFAALLYPLLSQMVTNNAAYAPLAAFTTLAFLAALSPLPVVTRAALAGLAIGAAFTVKQTAAFEGIALLAIVLMAPETAARRMRAATAFALSAMAAPLGFLLYFAAHGAAGTLIADVVLDALRRPASAIEGLSFVDGILRSLAFSSRPIAPILALGCLALLRRRAASAAAPNAAIGAMGLWAAAAILSLWAQRALFSAYLGPLLPPLLLLTGACLTFAAPELDRLAVPIRLALAGRLSFATAMAARSPGLDARQERGAIAIAAQAIKASRPAADDRLLVVNRGAWLYLATDLAPPTAYFHWEHTLADFPGAGPSRLAEALAKEPRYIVVADRTRRVKYELPESWRLVDAALARDYGLLAHAQGEADSYDVYQSVRPSGR